MAGMRAGERVETRRYVVDGAQPDPAVLAEAAAVIRRGGLVAFPTETVYGLGADALNAAAVRRIFAAKGRPASDPLIVHVAGREELARVVESVPAVAEALATRFWPGPLTFVLPKAGHVPSEVTAGGPTVAVRCPAHLLAQALIRAAGTPIAAPSANRFAHTSPTTADHVWDDLAGQIDLILDGGPTPIGVESTVLDLTVEPPAILRPGGVTAEELVGAIGAVARRGGASGVQTGNGVLASPGLLERHYAPHVELRLFTGPDEAVRAAMRRTAQTEAAGGRRVALLVAEEDTAYLAGLPAELAVLGSLGDLSPVARRLFDTLRRLETAGADLILARDFPHRGVGAAVHDRLRRAAAQVVQAADAAD